MSLDLLDNVLRFWKGKSSSSVSPDTREAALNFAGGAGAVKEIKIEGTGATVLNLFKFTGAILLKEITLIAKTVTDSTTFEDVKFIVSDDAASADLTAVVDGSSTVTGSKFYKSTVAGSALAHLKADQVRVLESLFNKPFVETVINAKPEEDNFIQLSFTGDGDTDIDGVCIVRWTPLSDDATLTVAEDEPEVPEE